MSDDTTVEVPEVASKERGLLGYIGIMLSVVLLVFVVALAVILIIVPKASGSIPLTVLTNSMAPGLPPGTLLVISPVKTDELKIGDVATYQIRSGEPDVITHRIIAITTSSDGKRLFTFQGDNNSDPDAEAVLPIQIQGRLWYSVPYVGFVNSAVNGQSRSWIIPTIAVALLAYATFMILSGLVAAGRKRRARAAAGQPDEVPLDTDTTKRDTPLS